ncbi:MAG TPA: hypothetical protein V6D00_11470 [Pantanalinema sp.]
MTRRTMGTYLALACGIAAAGCQAAPPSGTPGGASRAPAPVLSAERSVQGLDRAGFERMMQALPKQISNEQAERMLVKLPAEKLRAPLLADVRHAGYRVSAGEGQAMSWGHGDASAMAGSNLDYRFMSVGDASLPYISYYPYVYNQSNSYWAPYAAYWSGRYYYPYYQGYGSLYAPYSYSMTVPYAGVYALRTGTILR